MQPHRSDDQFDRPMVRPHPTINSRVRRRAHLVVLIGLTLLAVLAVRPTMAESAPAGAGGVIELVVTGRGGVPGSGVGAVALNVTVTNPTEPSYLTVWPTGAPRPEASNLNYLPGQTVPNMVIAKVGTGGRISLYNYTGSTDVIVDVLGWFPEGTGFNGLTPARLLDTRQATQPVGANGVIELVVTGRGGVPGSGVGAVALNVTVTNPTEPSYLTVWPTGAPRPEASNLNYLPGQTVPNMVIAKVGTGGRISLYNYTGSTDVIVDVLGWFPEGTGFNGLTPARLLDTRQATQPVGANGVIELVVTGRGGVPGSGVGAVALNVTVTNPTEPSYLTVWPTGAPRPEASNLNYLPGQTVPNMVIAKVGTGGRISLYNYTGSTDVIVDVLGWFPEGTGFNGLTPARLLDTRQATQPPTTTPPTTTPPTTTPPTTTPTTTPPTTSPPFVLQPGDWWGIPAGRYVMEQAQADCYWQRWSDAGDMWVELGVSYQFHPGRAVVDIGGYESLSFTEPCGPLTLLPSTGTPAATITNGVHVVNHHVLPGTYRIVLTEETRGCGWDRLSAFTGGPAAIKDGMYMSDAGEAYVTIFTSDVGFETDCLGTWARIG